MTFGIGFALNDRAALTFSYQQEHVFTAFENHQAIPGSPYSFGTFNFGLGYQISQSTRLNLSVGIGAGQNAPVAKVLLELPYRFSLVIGAADRAANSRGAVRGSVWRVGPRLDARPATGLCYLPGCRG